MVTLPLLGAVQGHQRNIERFVGRPNLQKMEVS